MRCRDCKHFSYSEFISKKSKNIVTKSNIKKFFPRFSFSSFTVSGLILKSLIHFPLTFVYGVRQRSNVILLHVDIQFSHHYLLKKPFLPYSVSLKHYQRSVECICMDLFPKRALIL